MLGGGSNEDGMHDEGTIGERLSSARPHDDAVERKRLRSVLLSRMLGEPKQPTTIGRYVVLRRIGAGAMGVVYGAYDPELDRQVAIKVLHPRKNATDDHRQLQREARSLARLSHPGIVTIHDIGTIEGQVWIAMELIEGDTLAAWVETEPRPWVEVLRVVVEAGLGLAAAHAEGIVHRDLKPENVMVSRDGRGLVTDFGLARPVLDADGSVRKRPDADTPLLSGTIAGTPAYMAPELLDGQPADVHSDQFAFCATAWEALFGTHPFRARGAGQTDGTQTAMGSAPSFAEFAEDIRAGRIRPAPPGSSVPSWLRSTIERGLSTRPGERWPDLRALLDALQRGQVRSRRRRIGLWLGSAVLVAAAALGLQRWQLHRAKMACVAEGDAVAELWNDARRDAVAQAMRATGLEHATRTATTVGELLDDYAEQWRATRVAACSERRVHDRWTAEQLERSHWCTEERGMELDALAHILEHADKEATNRAFAAATSLADVQPCGDARVLDRMAPIVEDGREEARELRRDLAIAAASMKLRQQDIDPDTAHALVERADASKWATLSSRARNLEANVLRRIRDYDGARASAVQAYLDATAIPAWDAAAAAAITTVGIAAVQRDREQAELWGELARVALDHAGETESLMAAVLLDNLGTAAKSASDYDVARDYHERSHRMTARILSEDNPRTSSPLLNLAVVDDAAGDYARAREAIERVVAIRERTLGPEHPDTGLAISNLAVVVDRMGELELAQQLRTRGLSIQEKALGPEHPGLASALNNTAIGYNELGEYARALELHERALSIRTKRFGPEHPAVATTLDNMAKVYENMGELERALELSERALAIREATLGPDDEEVADSLNNLGVRLESAGKQERAREMFDRALAIRERVLGPDHPDVAVALTNVAALIEDLDEAAAVHQRIVDIREATLGPQHPEYARALTNLALLDLDHSRALTLLEQAITIYDRTERFEPREAAARFGLARLVAKAGNHERGRTLAKQAAHAHRERGNDREVARVEAWLADLD